MEDDGNKHALNIFSAQFDKQKRHRSGYDGDAGVLLRNRASVTAFIDSEDPVQVLSDCTELVFESRYVCMCVIYVYYMFVYGCMYMGIQYCTAFYSYSFSLSYALPCICTPAYTYINTIHH